MQREAFNHQSFKGQNSCLSNTGGRLTTMRSNKLEVFRNLGVVLQQSGLWTAQLSHITESAQKVATATLRCFFTKGGCHIPNALKGVQGKVVHRPACTITNVNQKRFSPNSSDPYLSTSLCIHFPA